MHADSSAAARDHKRLDEALQTTLRSFLSSMGSTSQHVTDMDALVRMTDSLPLSKLAYWEHLIRDELAWAHYNREEAKRSWRNKVLALARVKDAAQTDRFPTWLDLVNGDGHLRERTLRTLTGAAPNGFFFALAARRLNDWVPQVRAAARDALPALALRSDPQHVVDTLCTLMPGWLSWGRVEAVDRQAMAELVCIEGVAAALVRRVIESTAGPMSAILAQALRLDVLDTHLPRIAADAVQPAVRARAYRALLRGRTTWVDARRWQWDDIRYCQGRLANVMGERTLQHVPELLGCLQAAAADRSSIVRRVAAEALVREIGNLGDVGVRLARKFADDASPAVSERGKFVLQRLAQDWKPS